MDWIPTADRVIVQKIQGEGKTEGGIFIPDAAADRSTTGVVVAVGPGAMNQHGVFKRAPVNVGDEVMFSPHGGMESPGLGEGTVVLFAEEILAVRKANATR